ncbi:SDR family NAD(P)-dependent oxidoreductase [Paracoccus aminophilus]|uniref:Short-chain dehydrogenase/reductase SDR n=1 Tax=Paracoccus aminophilus JCM 7686 TaxID=1367847 RepID=S5XR23_PARAH|nr:SDR family oxidoreductase [Paracoccus aminophilus]AGT09854.1 short-chain dehydrogenase/reductase SDR [Paracoccus aminophilus JCM 7686]
MAQNFATYPSLHDRSVFVTGGGSGIGASLVRHFCAQGARVAFVDIADGPSQELVAEIAGQGMAAPLYLNCDLREIEALQARIQEAAAAHGPVTVLCNNAGNDDRHASETVTPGYWRDRMAVNLDHQFFAAQTVRPMMRAAGGGSIINFSSITWMVGDADCPAYVTAKAAIWGLTRALAREFGPEGIRVNALLPGWVMTARQQELWLDEAGERQIRERQCLRDKVQPEDIARMALFLGADDSRLCTSQQFVVDGGWI